MRVFRKQAAIMDFAKPEYVADAFHVGLTGLVALSTLMLSTIYGVYAFIPEGPFENRNIALGVILVLMATIFSIVAGIICFCVVQGLRACVRCIRERV